MKITCFIEYQLDPSRVDLFEKYAENWAKVIPECGGELLGYFLPYEGTNNIGYGLISFNSLASYESYRHKLKKSDDGQKNFQFAQQEQFILSEKRTFLKAVNSTYKQNTREDYDCSFV